MKKNYLIFITLLAGCPLFSQVELTSSNLPILVITTPGNTEIPDEPKVDAHLGIIWNGGNNLNHIDAAFNHYDGNIGIEKRGSSSQALFPKVGYGFETRNADGSNNNVSLLGLPPENDWVLHGPYSDKSLIRNALAYTMAGWIMDYAPRVVFCEVMLNGDYRGVYVLTEKIKQDINRVDISKLNPDENEGDDLTGGYILKFDKYDGASFNGFLSQYPSYEGGGFNTFFQYHYPKPDEITPEQEAYINGYIATLENTLQSPDFADTLIGYHKFFDLPSFYQFLFIQEIGRNVDGYRLSTFFYKDKDSENDKLKFGPIWDFNLAFGNVNYCIGSGTAGWALDFNNFCPGDFWVIHFWWDRLWEDPAFIDGLTDYWFELRDTKLTNERVLHLVDSLQNLLQLPAKRNFGRWPILGTYIWPNKYVGETYQSEVVFVRNWLVARLAWMDEAMDQLAHAGNTSLELLTPETLPNPFHERMTFRYQALYQEVIRIEIYNAQGQLIDKITDPGPHSGFRTTDWEAILPAGIYFYKMKFSRGETISGRMVRN